MSNMIQAAREQVAALTQAAYERAAAEGLLPAGAEVKATIEIPKDVTHGDYASSFAMAGAKALRKAPRQIAEVIVSHLDLAGTFFDKVEIGKLNYHRSNIDWARFGLEAEELCKSMGLDYYIKESLRTEMESHHDD